MCVDVCVQARMSQQNRAFSEQIKFSKTPQMTIFHTKRLKVPNKIYYQRTTLASICRVPKDNIIILPYLEDMRGTKWKQESIPVGCIPPPLVATTRCQY